MAGTFRDLPARHAARFSGRAKYELLQANVERLSGYSAALHNNDIRAAAILTIVFSILVATLFGPDFFFLLFWPGKRYPRWYDMAKDIAVWICIGVGAAAIMSTIVVVANEAYITGVEDRTATELVDSYPRPPLLYHTFPQNVAWVVLLWLALIPTIASTTLMFKASTHDSHYGTGGAVALCPTGPHGEYLGTSRQRSFITSRAALFIHILDVRTPSFSLFTTVLFTSTLLIMTEYDFSPDAYERHLAKQAQIANWVDQTNGSTPANPFRPIPGEHGSANGVFPANTSFVPHYSVSERAAMQEAAAPPAIPQYGYPYGPYQPQYPNVNPYFPIQSPPGAVYYTTAQGVLPPTYAVLPGRSHKSRSKHSSGTRSLRVSPTSMPLALPSGPVPAVAVNIGGGLSHIAQQAQLARPMLPRSMSDPSLVTVGPGGVTIPMQSQQMPQTYVTYPTPYTSPTYAYPQVVYSAQTSPYTSPPPTYTYSRSSSRSHRSKSKSKPTSPSDKFSQSQPHLPLGSPPLPAGMGMTYIQPRPDQPMVVPINGRVGGYVVVPAKGQEVRVVQPSNHSAQESDGQSFFGRLSLKKSKSKKSSRRDSY
ncbi:unnamed protein product [Cyclocybe aegerita]|uniref:Uncharacterized protein n=1 Tax=Cyclocybe aegerita TaxID=1973307 RepID=A0A8S0WAY9_CYCAE|nr:unnamed protein product [Cyclocybe aegerita]